MDIHFIKDSIMRTKVQRWGNSQGVRISKKLLKNTQIQIGEEVDIAVQVGKIIIRPANKIRGRYNIEELVKLMPDGYNPTEENWGNSVGKEVW